MKLRSIVILVMLVLSAGIATAQQVQEEGAKYNFGTMQPANSVTIEPGNAAMTQLYFYNIYGNRVTHVVLSVGEAPQGWDVKIEPPLHVETVNVSGILTNVTENLYVEPSQTVQEKPTVVGKGMEYIRAGGVQGFIPSKVVKIIITAPKDAPLGKSYNLRIDAVASWLGQSGTASVTQERSFSYTITTLSKTYTEEVVKPEIKEETKEGLPVYAILIAALLIIIIVLLAVIMKKK